MRTVSAVRQIGVLTCVVAAVALGFFAASALGASRPTVTDPRGDSGARYPDIKSVSAATSPGSATWTIAAYNSFPLANAPCIVIRSVKPSGALWLVCGNAASGFGFSTRGSSYGVGGGYAEKAVVGRLQGRNSTAVYRVPRQTFAGIKPTPKGFTWQAESLNQSTGTIYDKAPNTPSVPFG